MIKFLKIYQMSIFLLFDYNIDISEYGDIRDNFRNNISSMLLINNLWSLLKIMI